MLEDARRFGMDGRSLADLQAALDAALPAGEDGIWPMNEDVVLAFLAVASQWRAVPVGGGPLPAVPLWIGLDYCGVRIGLRAAGIAVTRELWAGLRIMEAAAAAALNEGSKV